MAVDKRGKLVLTYFIISVLLCVSALAHVGYVAEDWSMSGPDANFLESALTPVNIALIIITILAVLLAYYITINTKLYDMCCHVAKRAHTYTPLISWMLRLSLGIALIGAGIDQKLISPLGDASAGIATLQIALGFMLMAGFLTPFAAAASALIYLCGLSTNLYYLGNLEFFAACIAVIAIADWHPGVDHLLGLKYFKAHAKTFVPLILRLGIGIAMLYLAVFEKFMNPLVTETVVYKYALDAAIPVSPAMWVLSTGVIEIAVGLCLLIGLFTRTTSIITFFVLSTTFFYFGEDVYSHITLFAIMSVLVVTGGGKYSLDHLFDPAERELTEKDHQYSHFWRIKIQ
jgi:uncharacterized membrane protein YphA (DoxX/SURF4 family)